MTIAEWLQRLEWTLVIVGSLIVICTALFCGYAMRFPPWFSRRRDRADLRHALHEILERHHAQGGIDDEQRDEIKRVLGRYTRSAKPVRAVEPGIVDEA